MERCFALRARSAPSASADVVMSVGLSVVGTVSLRG
jgi:hypothetical protein